MLNFPYKSESNQQPNYFEKFETSILKIVTTHNLKDFVNLFFYESDFFGHLSAAWLDWPAGTIVRC